MARARLLALIALAASLVSGISACGSAPPPPPKVEPQPDVNPLGGPGDAAAPVTVVPADAGSDAKAAVGDSLPADITVVARNQRVSAIALDAAHVYWIDEGDGAVMRAPKRGGIAMILYSGATFAAPPFIVVDESNVYLGVQDASQKSIVRVDKSAGKATTLATPRDELRGLALDATGVHWISGAAVVKVGKGGGAAAAVGGAKNEPTSLAVAGGAVFFTNKDGITIVKGGGPKLVPMPGANHVQSDGTSVYFVVDKKIQKMPAAGGAATVIAESEGDVACLALDNTHVYFTSPSGKVSRVAKEGGAKAEEIASGLGTLGAIVVDDTSLYFVNRGTEAKQFKDGSVMKKPKAAP